MKRNDRSRRLCCEKPDWLVDVKKPAPLFEISDNPCHVNTAAFAYGAIVVGKVERDRSETTGFVTYNFSFVVEKASSAYTQDCFCEIEVLFFFRRSDFLLLCVFAMKQIHIRMLKYNKHVYVWYRIGLLSLLDSTFYSLFLLYYSVPSELFNQV